MCDRWFWNVASQDDLASWRWKQEQDIDRYISVVGLRSGVCLSTLLHLLSAIQHNVMLQDPFMWNFRLRNYLRPGKVCDFLDGYTGDSDPMVVSALLRRLMKGGVHSDGDTIGLLTDLHSMGVVDKAFSKGDLFTIASIILSA